MNITSAQYVSETLLDGTTQNASVKATIDGTEVYVPLTTANRHYAEIMRQVEANELTIQPADSE